VVPPSIATFKSKPSPSESFKRFFEINPDPAVPLENIGGIKKWIRDGRDFKDRCHRAEDFLSAQERSRTVRTDPDSEYDVWTEPIRCEFTDPYAIIQRQRRFGELDGKYPST
jgi:hypothetical protein